MAQIEDQHYKELSPYFCPRCGKYYSKVRIGIGLHSFYRRYFFCLKGCARNFNLNGEDVTTLVERGEY